MPFTLLRDLGPEAGHVFVAMPYGKKSLADGSQFDFDQFYSQSLRRAIEDCQLIPERADDIYGPNMVMDVVWRGLQRAEIVLVDFSSRAPNVALEFGMALLINKRIITLAQDFNDVPSDVRGLYKVITYTSNFADVQNMETELANQLAEIRSEHIPPEMALVPFSTVTNPAVDHVPVTIVAVHKEFAIVLANDGSGRRGVLGNDEVDYTRIIFDMTKRFEEGHVIKDGAFVLDLDGGARYTLLAGQTDPWPLLAASHPKHQRFTGQVRSVKPAGIFVSVDHGVNGLISIGTLASTERIRPGDEVEVEIYEIDTARRLIKLNLIDLGPYSKGERVKGKVRKVVAEKGFTLIELPNTTKTAMLNAKQMTDDMRRKLDNGDVKVDSEVYVEVIEVDRERFRVSLRELNEVERDDLTEDGVE
ncbi:S1 RNA-binding domain-containing protein [Kitasatospora sp. NPDC050543]|uniref:S1 RNA-binding domain-containing protein n=1 Tax=Kitasatospora sp. NPDC050543 TaxID=3364054 RepID=UPI00379D146F